MYNKSCKFKMKRIKIFQIKNIKEKILTFIMKDMNQEEETLIFNLIKFCLLIVKISL